MRVPPTQVDAPFLSGTVAAALGQPNSAGVKLPPNTPMGANVEAVGSHETEDTYPFPPIRRVIPLISGAYFLRYGAPCQGTYPKRLRYDFSPHGPPA